MTMRNEEKVPREEEYAFLQEVIKDEADSGKTRKKKILRGIRMGIIVGLTACFTFFVSKTWFESQFPEKPQTVTIPEDEEEIQKDEEATNQQERTSRQLLSELRQVSAKLEGSLVEIVAYEELWQDDARQNPRCNSGVIIADNGRELLILSNDAIVKNGEDIQVRLRNGSEYEGKMKQCDANLGLCIYAIQREDISKESWKTIQIAELGSSNAMENGDLVLALGKPFGEDEAEAYGILMNDTNLLNVADGDYRLLNTNIETYASGSGILANESGEVVGILNTSTKKDGTKGEIAAFAISDIKNVIELLSNGKAVPYLGIFAEDVTDEMQEEGIPAGIYVKEVEEDSPAMAAGIQNGDILTSIDDVEINTYKIYSNTLSNQTKGKQVIVKGLRAKGDQDYVEIEFRVTIDRKEN